MNAFKRLCLFVFGLAGIACLAALVLPWLGPWTEWAISMLRVPWYYITVEVCVCITALGLLISLLRALFSPRRHKSVVVTRAGGDRITVTTAAISSQATHIAESRGDFTVERVRVSAGKRAVDVFLRVRPTYAMNITEVGEALHAELVGGLSELAGESIRSVEIEFVEADSLDAAPAEAYETSAPSPRTPAAQSLPAPTSGDVSVPVATEPASYEITVPISHVSASGTEGEDSFEGGAPSSIEVEPEPFASEEDDYAFGAPAGVAASEPDPDQAPDEYEHAAPEEV